MKKVKIKIKMKKYATKIEKWKKILSKFGMTKVENRILSSKSEKKFKNWNVKIEKWKKNWKKVICRDEKN